MNFLRIWITLPDGETTELGELAFDEPRANGTAATAFRYASSWLARKDAFPLNPDPQMLPLVATEFQASHLGPPLQALNDALPDDYHCGAALAQVPAKPLLDHARGRRKRLGRFVVFREDHATGSHSLVACLGRACGGGVRRPPIHRGC